MKVPSIDTEQEELFHMNDTKNLWALRPIDWKWIGMGYCYFVVFHMLPSYFFTGTRFSLMRSGFVELMGVWLFIGLAFVAFFIGFHSRGVTVIEPGLSSLMYAITIFFYLGRFTGQDVSLRTIGYAYITALMFFLTAVLSAWLGEKMQQRKERQGQAALDVT